MQPASPLGAPERPRAGILCDMTRRQTSSPTWTVAASAMALLLAFLMSLLPATVAGQAESTPGLALDVRGSPLPTDGSGSGVVARVTLEEPARLRLRVTDFDGRLVRELFEGERQSGSLVRSWRGRDETGDPVPPGPYRVVATAAPVDRPPDAEDARASAWVTVAERPVYPANPGIITVAVDPGHGGRLDGAVGRDGTREADLNLDIGLRLTRMLEGAGVGVVLTRDTDRFVNTPEVDRTFDGVADETDELAARPDLANAARADLYISVHNNIAVNTSVGGPSTYYFDQRTFGDRSARLASIIQARMVAAFAGLSAGDWRPHDHGTLVYPYYVLRGYDPPRLLRPTQMPGVLSEGLFLSNPRELRLLKQPRVRQAMANAYYEAIAEYLARRGSHVGYALVSGPTEVAAGTPLELSIEVRHQGSERMRGWRLGVGALPADSKAVGRARNGSSVGSRRIPALAPGQTRTLRVPITAPVEEGAWTLMVDALDRRGRRASRSGSPMLQVPLTTTAPPPSPTPVPAPSALPPASPSGPSLAPTPASGALSAAVTPAPDPSTAPSPPA
jgi:N-acetylmuramoyl-L-alanine amidase